MGSIFSLLIITPTKRIKYDDVSSITLSTTAGEVTILKNHLPMIANIDITPLKIVREDKEEIYALAVGVLKIDKDFQVTIIVDTFERREDIDISRAEQKKIEAEEILAKKPEGREYKEAERTLKKSLLRIKLKSDIK